MLYVVVTFNGCSNRQIIPCSFNFTVVLSGGIECFKRRAVYAVNSLHSLL
jgi:hypothetical protein